MVTCYNCGKQVSDETLICPECGALVRRYEAQPRKEQEPECNTNTWDWQNQRPQQNQQQQNWQQNAYVPPYQAGYTQPIQNGKFRYSSGFSVWLWLSVAGLAFFILCFIISGLAIAGGTEQAQLFYELFQQQGVDLAAIENGEQVVANIMYINAAGCVLMIVLELVLYFVRSRRAVLINVIGSLVLSVTLIFLVGLNIVAIMILVIGMVNNLLLRRQIPYMKR